MRIFVAGATGAIGQPLVTELIRQGHTVTGMTSNDAGAKLINSLGASVAQVSVFDAAGVEEALRRSQAEVVIDELTSLPKDHAHIASAAAADRKVRWEGGGNLQRAAMTTGVRRYIQQASGFFLKSDHGLADESAGLITDASPFVAGSARLYQDLESRLQNLGSIEGVALRYGFFYGPKTWYYPEGTAADAARRQEMPIMGQGEGVWSWVHIEDAALATVAALTAPAGVYNIVDDHPSPCSEWIPNFARWVDAPPPRRITEQQAKEIAGEDAVYYATKLRGASNKKAKEVLGFRPRRTEWLAE
jgi:nucleoside-diphosphate-sugar epimerase